MVVGGPLIRALSRFRAKTAAAWPVGRAKRCRISARLGAFRIAIDIPGVKEERHLEGARRSAEKWLVKNTLLTAPQIELTVRATQAVT